MIRMSTPKVPCFTIGMLLFLLIAQNGCSRFREFGNLGYNEPYDFKDKDTIKRDYSSNFRVSYDQAILEKDFERARQERNEIIGELMLLIDADHGRLERNLRGNKTFSAIFFDFAQLGLTGAATVTGGAATKSVLSAIATGVKGAELSIDKQAFQEQTVEALLSTMRASQTERKLIILGKLNWEVDEYPLELALGDIVQYFYDGTLTRGFERLAFEAQQREREAETKLMERKPESETKLMEGSPQ